MRVVKNKTKTGGMIMIKSNIHKADKESIIELEEKK